MLKTKRFIYLLLYITGLCAALPATAQNPTAFQNVNVLPMDSPEPVLLETQTVIVDGERITRIGPSGDITIPDGARVIDGSGHTLMPGLAEMHAHVPAASNGRLYVEEVLFLYVANGVTTARGMLGEPSHLELREQLANHEVLGPRLFTSGPSLNNLSAINPDLTARLVREQAAAGYDFVKVHPGPSRASYDAAVQAAAESGTTLAGHVPASVGVLRAIEARQVTIDHLDGYVEALAPPERRDNGGFFGLDLADAADPAGIPALVAATRDAGVWNVPTMTLIEHWPATRPTLDELLARPEMAYVSPQTREQWANAKRQQVEAAGYSAAKADALVEIRRQIVRAMHEDGAPLLLGSDAPQVFNVPGFSLHHEIAAMARAGVPIYDVLRSGTANPARFFNAENEFGTIREGLAADLILIAGNPLEDLDALASPAGVMVRGHWLDREALNAGLEEIAARYRP